MNWGALGWLVVLLLANGFFVAAEFAYITARGSVLEQQSGAAARTAVGLGRDLSLSLAAAQLGITMASLVLGAVAEPAVAAIIEQGLSFLPIPEAAVHPIAFAVALMIVVFLHMVIGEMAPKNIAISAPERSATLMAIPFRAFIVVLRPVIVLLNGIANAVLRLFGVQPTEGLEAGHSAQDLATIIASGREEGVIEDFAHRLLTGAIVFADRDAFEVMVPRPDVVAVTAGATYRDVESVIERTGHSRIPVHTGDLDDVLGFLHVKDLLDLGEADLDTQIEAGRIRPMAVVAETASAEAVIGDLRRLRTHMALVVDEHGSVAGLITLEDIAEELLGEIRDEYDPRTSQIHRLGDDRFLALGSVRPHELEAVGIDLPDGEYETIAGFVMERLGRIPVPGDLVEDGGVRVRVLRMDRRRIRDVEVTLLPTADEPA